MPAKNKGLSIRDNKLKKQSKKRNVIKEDQQNICQFITLEYQIIEEIKGRYTHVGKATENCLQVKNRAYLLDGHYKMINNKNVKVINRYSGIPEWANEFLISKYKEFHNC